MNKCSEKFLHEYKVKSEAFICSFNFNEFNNIYGHILQTKKYFITNDISKEFYAHNKFPEGHPHIKSFIGIPIFKRNTDIIVAIMGFANSGRILTDKDYKLIKNDIEDFQKLMIH